MNLSIKDFKMSQIKYIIIVGEIISSKLYQYKAIKFEKSKKKSIKKIKNC